MTTNIQAITASRIIAWDFFGRHSPINSVGKIMNLMCHDDVANKSKFIAYTFNFHLTDAYFLFSSQNGLLLAVFPL